jgi:lipoic acid synthetase
MENNLPLRKPEWLKVKSNSGAVNAEVEQMLRSLGLHTVCEEAGCPNCGECFARHTATFMILGRFCTRNCRFCNVTKQTPTELDINEPHNIALAVQKLGLRHVVITSVTRDDLLDGGATHFANVINAIKQELGSDKPVIEVLIPDFQGDEQALETVIAAKPNIINHNVETIPRLYSEVRPMAIYSRSLELLARVKAKDKNTTTKSGIMLGLGEKYEEVIATMADILKTGCDLLTIGQYLAPSKNHIPVVKYIHPDVFAKLKEDGEKMGFKYVASGPLVRSSYLADKAFEAICKG